MNIKAGLLAIGELLYRLSPIQLETYVGGISQGPWDEENRMRCIRLGFPFLSTFVEIKIGTQNFYSNDFGEEFNHYQGVKLQLPIATFRASTDDGRTSLSLNSVRELLSNFKRPFKYTSIRYRHTKKLEAKKQEAKRLLKESEPRKESLARGAADFKDNNSGEVAARNPHSTHSKEEEPTLENAQHTR